MVRLEGRENSRRKRDKYLEWIRMFWPIGVAIFVAIGTWVELKAKVVNLDERVKTVETSEVQVRQNTTAIAVLQANVDSIKENVDDVKRNTERIITRLDRMNK